MALVKKSNRIADIIIKWGEDNKNMDKIFDGTKEKLMLDKLNETMEFQQKLLDLDSDLNNNEIISDSEIYDKLNKINETSLIIYIKKAQIYKVYNQDNIGDFINDDNTIYRKLKAGLVHEVVRDNMPQKLMIVVNDDIRDDQLESIKKNIIEFVKKNPAFINTTNDDLRCYSDNNSTEFVLTNLRMENITKKDRLIEKFMTYLEKNNNHELAAKIKLRHKPSHLEGARLYKLPSLKISLDTNLSNYQIKNEVASLMTTAVGKQTPIIINNTFNINYKSNNTINSNTTVEKKTLDTFKNYLRDNRPAWYIDGEMVDMMLIENAYKAYFNDNSSKASVISRQLNGIIFNESKRSNGITKKKLMPLN